MDKFVEVRTVLGIKKISKNTVTLSHEHIVPKLDDNIANKILKENPLVILCGK